MASIIKRGKKYAVIYDYTDADNKRKQKWESCPTHAEAVKRKIEVEKEQLDGTFIIPNANTVNEFLDIYVELYGTKTWAISTYEKNTRLLNNYVIPYIGYMKLQDITPLFIENYLIKLRNTPKSCSRGKRSKENITSGTIKQIHKVLRCAFGMAVKWQLLASNPFTRIEAPKTTYKKQREIWTSEMIAKALEVCDDPKLAIAMHLAFADTLRIGEALGLQWKNVHIDDIDLENDNAHIYVNAELTIVSREIMKKLEDKDILFDFPTMVKRATKTVMVLKTPKTESSRRKIWLPQTLANILRAWKEEQNKYKEYFGDEYTDYDLVICHEDGRPCSPSVIEKGIKNIAEVAGLPKVVFHSLRHSSTTYKLKLSNGDIKATQGDTGHTQPSMVTEVYSHILDEDRKVNAQKFEKAFYQKADNNDQSNKDSINIDRLMEEIKEHPELLENLKKVLL